MKHITTFVAFCAGGMVAINLTYLLAPVQTDYDAQWWKVIAAIATVFFLSIADDQKGR